MRAVTLGLGQWLISELGAILVGGLSNGFIRNGCVEPFIELTHSIERTALTKSR